MQNNKKVKRSRRRLITQIMCLFLCLLMVGGVFLSVLPIGDSHDHSTDDFDHDNQLTLDDILNSIETENKDNSITPEKKDENTTPTNPDSTPSDGH